MNVYGFDQDYSLYERFMALTKNYSLYERYGFDQDYSS